jgi:putative transposase
MAYRRIVGELKLLGVAVSPTSMRKVLRVAGLRPAPERAASSWRAFLRQQGRIGLSCGDECYLAGETRCRSDGS